MWSGQGEAKSQSRMPQTNSHYLPCSILEWRLVPMCVTPCTPLETVLHEVIVTPPFYQLRNEQGTKREDDLASVRNSSSEACRRNRSRFRTVCDS